MKIGVPKEVKDKEARVAIVPEGVKSLVAAGNIVIIEKGAGIGSGYTDKLYELAGAVIVTVDKAWDVELVVKVKEPQETEYQYLNGQMVFTFFHLAGVSKRLTEALISQKVTAIAYESLEDEAGRLPILEPMSAIAGNMSVLMGAYYLSQYNHGNGMQLGSVLGVGYGKVVIIGDGVVGRHAAKVAVAMGAKVVVAGLDKARWLRHYQQQLAGVEYVQSNEQNIAKQIRDADLVVGAVLCRGLRAPKVLTEKMLKEMGRGSVVVDVSIDQGGCFETSRVTSHSDPVFIKHGVIHYCVSNMPGAYPRTSTEALAKTTIAYIEEIAGLGVGRLVEDVRMVKAINIYKGVIVVEEVARELNLMSYYGVIDAL